MNFFFDVLFQAFTAALVNLLTGIFEFLVGGQILS